MGCGCAEANRNLTHRLRPGAGPRGRGCLDHLIADGGRRAVGRQRRRFHAAPHRRAGTLDVFQHLVTYERGQSVYANARAVLAVRRTGNGVQQTCSAPQKKNSGKSQMITIGIHIILLPR